MTAIIKKFFENDSVLVFNENDLPGVGDISQIQSDIINLQTNKADKLQNNLVATTDPTITNDSSEGYSVLSVWINTSTNEIFKCLSNTDGAAIWVKTSLTIDELGSMALENATDYYTETEINNLLNNKQDILLEGAFVDGDKTKLDGIDAGAEVNNISDTNATDLTDGGDSILHYHSTDRNRANHTGTQDATTITGTKDHNFISDYDTQLAGTTNTTAFTPTADYHPATKKYVDDNAGGGGATTLDDLTDVTITTPVNGQALIYNGTQWVNSTPAGSGDMLKSENLSGLANYATARTNLGLDTTANQTDSTDKRFMTDVQESKLDGIASGATANDTDANLRDRTTHTGTQPFNTITEIDFDLPITVGQSLVYNGTTWTNSNPTPAVGSARTLYLDPTSTIADNLYLNTSPPSFPETTKTSVVDADISGGLGFLERFVSGPLGRTDIPAGNWTFNTYASTSNNTGTDTIQIRVNKRVEMSGMTGTFTGTGITRTFTVTGGTPFVAGDAGTILTASLIETPNQTVWISSYVSSSQVVVTLTDAGYINESNVNLNAIYYLLFNSGETSDITGTSPVNYVKTITQPAFVVNPTDRIVTAYFAKATSGTARTITLYYGGTTAYSNILTPLTTNHGDLGGLNNDDHTQYALVSGVRAFTGNISAPNLSGTNTGDETTTTLGSKINSATEKTTPVDADMIGLMDSAAGNILKKLSWLNLKATLKTYFDTLYQAVGSYITSGGALGTPSSGTLTNCSGLPLSGVVDSTTEALGVGTLELGHASDTTLTRVSAGVIAVEGVTIPSISSTSTLTNKTINLTNNTLSGTLAQFNAALSDADFATGGGTATGTNTGDQTITLTGDVTGTGTGSFATTLANTTVTPGSYTTANITVDSKGRITAAANGSGGGGGSQKLRITIPGELIADTSNYQGLYFKNESGASWTISNVAIAVGINASGTGAACAINLYKSSGTEADGINTSATNLFTTAVDLGTTYSSLTNVPNTTTIEDGRWLSLRITSSAGATRRASDMQVVITLS